jgi:microsomal dipeptidase-like Zn-dependent dipeptidase
VVDLHCHFPMRLLGGVEAPRDVVRGMLAVRARDAGRVRAFVLMIAARLLNFRHWGDSWRVDPELLRRGGVSVVLSVLYRPFSELDLERDYAAAPAAAYYGKLTELMDATEREVEASGGVMVRRLADLRSDRTAYVHCVEGGFHLGASRFDVDAHVRELAGRGVAYITLAHLFWRRVAKNAPALPFLPDALYDALFPQRAGAALSDLGVAAVEAMYRAHVLVDISHMREDAIDATFAVINRLDRETGADPAAYPVIVSHAGFRLGAQKYNVSAETVRRVAARDGVIGLICAQHQVNDGVRRTGTKTLSESLDVLGRHIDAIHAVTGSYDHIAIGSDLDGFIRPTLGGVESAADLAQLAGGLRERYPAAAEKILTENALRVLERRFAA